MKPPSPLLATLVIILPLPIASADESTWSPLFDGRSLEGWHISAKSGHSAASDHKSGGRWEVVDGAITGSQDTPGNGGLIVTDEKFSDFEVKLEMKNDFGPDSGLFLRSTEDGKAWQAMIDYHANGNLMGIYGEGLGGNPHVRNYNFAGKVTEIEAVNTGNPPVALPILPEAWSYFWRADQWNELRARIVGNPPHITTWINGVKIMEWRESEIRHPETGAIALQVHGGGDHTKEFVRYRNIQVRQIKKETAAASSANEKGGTVLSSAAAPAAPAAPAANETKLIIGVVPAVMQFDKKAFAVKARDRVRILFTNKGCPLQHNLIILKPGTDAKFGAAADKMITTDPAGAMAKVYVPDDAESQAAIIAASKKLIGIGQNEEISFTAPSEAGQYPYICTFPGHRFLMKGVMTVTD